MTTNDFFSAAWIADAIPEPRSRGFVRGNAHLCNLPVD
jgi:hypothetical protein